MTAVMEKHKGPATARRATKERQGHISAETPRVPSADPADAAVARGALTRSQAAERIGVSKATVRRLEARGELHPTVGANEVRLFAEEEVQLVSRRRRIGIASCDAGDEAAEVFALLEAGTHPVEIVMQLRLDPERVLASRDRWAAMRGAVFVSANGLRRLATSLQLRTPPNGECDLVEAVEGRLDAACKYQQRLLADLQTAREAARGTETLRAFVDAMNGADPWGVTGPGGSPNGTR